MINKDEYSCLPTPVGRSIMCVSNKSCKNGRKMYPIDVDVISCSSNGQWHRLSRSNNQSFDNINDNPSLPLLPRCIDLAAPPVSFEVILNISGHIEKACLEPLINATKDKLGQLIRENCGNQFEYTVVFQSGESQWKPGLSRPVYQVTIPGTVETIVPDAQVHLAKVCISQFASRLSTMPPIFEPTECSTIQLVSQAGILKEGDTKCEPGWILVDSTEQLPSLCQKCPAGTFADRLTDQCAPCPKGSYSSVDGAVECTVCGSGHSTGREYGRSPADCLSECAPGYYSATGLAPCNSCAVGFFQQNTNQTGCESCPAGTTTATSATTNMENCKRPCVPGQYSDTGLEPCQPCPYHHFQPLSAQMHCIRCSFGMVTDRVGVRAPSDCLVSIPCTDDYCHNNGTCTTGTPLPHCDCPLGFAGADCSTPINLCFSAFCENGGTCHFDQLKSTCDCRPGFDGERCEKVTLCSENPCMNGGTCAAGPEHVECICPEPYSGQYCQDPRSDDPCAGVSCTNGTCTTVEGGGSVCDCDPGFELRDGVCTLLGPCAFQPCVNTTSSTTCSDSIDNFDSSARFRCICDPNWTGEFCERTVRNCSTTECNNNGTCVMVSESGNLVPKCICPPRFTGPTCAESRVACDSSGTSLSCSGHGKCQNNGDHFICHCDIGYVGEFCSVRKNSCYDSPCLNGATCTDELEQPTCHCTHGWTGQICATQIDHCEPNNPCENGGTCLSVFGGYSCHCASSYTGTNCSIFIDPCCSTPCMYGATCTNVGGGYGGNYTCECTPGHTGHNCDQPIDICASNPCGANATCVPGESGSFNCVCTPGYEYIDGRCIQRDPCSGIAESICDHGGTCIPSGNTYSCKCLPGFTGSYCEQAIPCATNPCGANGTCVQIQDSSQYNCTCDYGFSGVNCSQNEQLCSSTNNPCLNGGQCVENPGGFLSCNCLANYTGLHCESAKKLNFNLFFTGSPGMKQIVSYDFSGTLLQEFTLCSWIRYQSSSATSSQLPALQIPFITMASYGESISSDTPLLLIDGSSVSIGGTQRLNWTIDEHQWHHVCVRSPKASDKAYNWTLSVDGVIVGSKLLQQLPDQSGRKYQLLLGQSVDGTRLFSGQLSLVQLYYIYMEDSEIAEMYFECNKWLNESDSSKTIIDWNQFTTVDKYDSSVMALYPGICIQSSCLPGHVGCEIDKTPPEVVFCPTDQQKVSPTRLAVVNWEQPLFRDNVQVTEVKANYRSGQVFVWGEYQVIYIARDGAGNTAVCAFTVVVAPGNCSEINSPVNGAAAFVQPDGANGTLYARIKCLDDYGFSEVVRDFYTCDKMGRWDPLMTSELPYTFPACSKTSDPLQSLDGIVEMKDAPCEDKDDLTKKFVELINDANTKYNFFCGGPECNQQLKVTPYCGENPEGNFRRKRQASSNGVGITYSLTVNATRKAVQPYVNDTLQNSIFGRNGTIGTITTSWDCTHPLSEYMADTFNDVHQCVECPPGKFWNSSSQICQYCPLNSYQNQPNQTACIPCPNGKLTATTGTQGESDCFPKCNPGEKYSFAKGQCVVCDMGTYQPQPGSISCIPCPDGMSTPGNKSTNRTDCEYPCSPGQQLTVGDYCQDCDRGTYKVWRNQTACVSCPIGFTTLAVGAKLKSQCNVLNCPPGTYIKAGLNTPVNVENGYAMYCPLCAIGFYQEASNQTMCQACNQGDVTSALGSTGVKDCTPGKFNDCRPDLEGTCPTNQTCAQTDMGYQCTTVLGAEVKPVSGSWHVWVGITAGLVLFAILVAVVIVVFKIRVYQFIFCCKHPNLKDISTTQYYRNNTYPITHTSSADEAVSTVTSKTMVAGDIGVSIDSMSAADVYKEIYAGLQSTQSDETLFDYLAGGTGSPPGTASFDESPDDPGPSSPPPPILPPPRPSRERFEANSAGFYNPSFDSAGAQSPTWEQSDAFETPSVSSSWAKIEQLNRRGASDSVLFASGSITMRSNGFRRQTAARAFEPQPWPSSVQPPAAHSDDDDDDDYFG
uniref:Uncharacterized protein n=1 Tax=Plectus sambesii TaxID=2011161 RepID=A0A914UJI5_9BILA